MEKKDLQDLIKKYPDLYDHEGFYFFECGGRLVRSLDQLSNKLVALKKKIKVGQVKEKYGGLRFYLDEDESEKAVELIDDAETLSYETCSKCGSTKGVELENRYDSPYCGECRNQATKQ